MAWLMLVVVMVGHVVAAWLWMAPIRSEYRNLINHGAAGIDP
jgi:hypothetical protein